MKTQTKQKLIPIIERGQTKIKVPCNDKYVTFAYPSFGQDTYVNVGKQILENNLQIPTGEQTTSLLYTAYFDDSIKDEPEFENIRNIMKDRWLWIFNRNLWTDKGVYVIQGLGAKGRSEILELSDLEKSLKNAEEINGVRFSGDRRVRFAPKETYRLEYNSQDELAKNGFVIASYGVKEAEQLAEISEKFSDKPYVYGLNINQGKKPELRVSALDECGAWLRVNGVSFDDYWGSCAFGVLK